MSVAIGIGVWVVGSVVMGLLVGPWLRRLAAAQLRDDKEQQR